MDNENELQDSPELAEETVQEPETDNDEESSAHNELEEKNRRLFERAKKAEAEAKELKAKPLKEPEEVKDDSTTSRLDNLELIEKKRQFGYEHSLSPNETDAVFKLNTDPSKETLDDPFVKGGIEAIRSAKKLADNTPSPSKRSIKIDAEKQAKMTVDERQAAFKKRQEARKR